MYYRLGEEDEEKKKNGSFIFYDYTRLKASRKSLSLERIGWPAVFNGGEEEVALGSFASFLEGGMRADHF